MRGRMRTYGELGRLLIGGKELLNRSGMDSPGTVPRADEVRAARRLAATLEAGGPTFVKLGQLLSTRSELLAPAYLDALSRLQDDVAPFDGYQARQIVEDELGASVSDMFAHFEMVPMAAASLGQVHRAELRDGTAVVVKVQRPGVTSQISADMATLGQLAHFLDSHSDAGRRFGFSDFFQQFRLALLDELDYRREAANLDMLRRIVTGNPELVVPAPVTGFTSGRVLTMEEVRGTKITALSGTVLADIDGRSLADALFRSYLEQVFKHGFFHADPHPGNILLTEDHRIAIIDLGMVGYLTAEMRLQLMRLMLSVVQGAGEQVAEVMMRISRHLDDFDEQVLRRDVGHVVARHQTSFLGASDVSQVVMGVSAACGRAGLRPPPELGMLARAIFSLQKVAELLDPGFDAGEVVSRHAADILAAESTVPQGLIGSLLETRDFVEQLPGRVNRVVAALADGELRIKVRAFDEDEMLRGLQKLANRMAMGLVVAALILGGAIFSLASPRRGYDFGSIAIACFAVGAVAGVVLLVSMVVADHEVKARSRRRQR